MPIEINIEYPISTRFKSKSLLPTQCNLVYIELSTIKYNTLRDEAVYAGPNGLVRTGLLVAVAAMFLLTTTSISCLTPTKSPSQWMS
jgi:hypothetical protein